MSSSFSELMSNQIGHLNVSFLTRSSVDTNRSREQFAIKWNKNIFFKIIFYVWICGLILQKKVGKKFLFFRNIIRVFKYNFFVFSDMNFENFYFCERFYSVGLLFLFFLLFIYFDENHFLSHEKYRSLFLFIFK